MDADATVFAVRRGGELETNQPDSAEPVLFLRYQAPGNSALEGAAAIPAVVEVIIAVAKIVVEAIEKSKETNAIADINQRLNQIFAKLQEINEKLDDIILYLQALTKIVELQKVAAAQSRLLGLIRSLIDNARLWQKDEAKKQAEGGALRRLVQDVANELIIYDLQYGFPSFVILSLGARIEKDLITLLGLPPEARDSLRKYPPHLGAASVHFANEYGRTGFPVRIAEEFEKAFLASHLDYVVGVPIPRRDGTFDNDSVWGIVTFGGSLLEGFVIKDDHQYTRKNYYDPSLELTRFVRPAEYLAQANQRAAQYRLDLATFQVFEQCIKTLGPLSERVSKLIDEP